MWLVASHLALALLAASMAWGAQGWRLQARIDALRTEQATAAARAQADALDKQAAFTAQLQRAQSDAARREQQLQAAVAAGRRTVDGLRADLAAANAVLPQVAEHARLAYARTAAELLGACAERYLDVAAAADRHADDALMLQEAWPQ